jgi:type II secretory pathway pseudopilin PulG
VNRKFGIRNSEFGARAASLSTARIPNSEFRIHAGFTLFEVALVLALLIVIGALAWPSLSGMFDSERLKQAADQVRSDLIRARVTAMNTGRVHSLSVDETRSRYFVVPVDDGSADPFSVPGDVNPAAALPVISRTLPEGITLWTVMSVDDATPPPAVAAAPGFGSAPAAAPSSGSAVGVFFHPDGTTSSALVTLSLEGNLFLDVRLRGLTGGTVAGEIASTQSYP